MDKKGNGNFVKRKTDISGRAFIVNEIATSSCIHCAPEGTENLKYTITRQSTPDQGLYRV